MAKEKLDVFRILRIKKGDDLKTIYAKAHRAFTAADLQRYTQDDEMLPTEQLVEDMNAMVHEHEKNQKQRKKRTRKKA
jgi:hypothetical protein